MKLFYYDTEEYYGNMGGLDKSIFLAGPTPREYLREQNGEVVVSWRPTFIKLLQDKGFNGSVFVPEPFDGKAWPIDYNFVCHWEHKHLDRSTVIIFWLPRNLKTLPGFTTNVEFGYYLGRAGVGIKQNIFYGRPENTPKTRYLDWMYRYQFDMEPAKSTSQLADEALHYLNVGGG